MLLKVLMLAFVLVGCASAQLICECDDGSATIQYYCQDPSPCHQLNCPGDCGCPGGGRPGCDNGGALRFTPIPKYMRDLWRQPKPEPVIVAQVAALNRTLLVARL